MVDMNTKVETENRETMRNGSAWRWCDNKGEERAPNGFLKSNWDGYRRVTVPTQRMPQVRTVSPNQRMHNQINHVIISIRWRSSLQDARVKCQADESSGHNLLMAKVKIRMVIKAKSRRVQYNSDKFKKKGYKIFWKPKQKQQLG